MAGERHRQAGASGGDAGRGHTWAVRTREHRRRAPGGAGGAAVTSDRALRAGQRPALARPASGLAARPVPIPHGRADEHPPGRRAARRHDVPRRDARLRPPRQVRRAGGERDPRRDPQVRGARGHYRGCARVDSGVEVVFRLRVVPVEVRRGSHCRQRHRVPAARPLTAAIGSIRDGHRARVGGEDRGQLAAIEAAAPAEQAQRLVPAGQHPDDHREPARFLLRMPRGAAVAGDRLARDLLPPEQSAGDRRRRGRARHAAAAAAGSRVKLEIVHSTRYRYSTPTAETVMEVRLRPMDGNGQRCLDFKLELSHGAKARTYVDGFGNHVHYFNLVRPHAGLSVVSRSTVETGLGPDPHPGEELVQDFLRFRSPVKDVEGVRSLARRHAVKDLSSAASVEQALDELTATISREFAYDRTVTHVYSAVDDVLTLRAGVCQDFAHLFIAVARAMDVPARYVSGYIHLPGEKSATTASHAWAEAWVAGRGWIGFDATHPMRTTEHHVRVAVGRDYSDAAPTRGIYVGSATGSMKIRVRTRELSSGQ